SGPAARCDTRPAASQVAPAWSRRSGSARWLAGGEPFPPAPAPLVQREVCLQAGWAHRLRRRPPSVEHLTQHLPRTPHVRGGRDAPPRAQLRRELCGVEPGGPTVDLPAAPSRPERRQPPPVL